MPMLNYTTESYGGLLEPCEEKDVARMIRTRLRRLRDRDTRRLIVVIMAGKMLGIVAALVAIKGIAWYFGAQASAATLRQAAVKADDVINPINTIWVLVTAFLVFFMQAGFMGLEAGFARSRETVNVLMECVFDTCLCGLLYWAFGFAFQFGAGNGFIGHQYFFLHGAPQTYGTTGVAFLAFWLFQFAFADTASTVAYGAMVGRTGFKGDILYSTAVSGFIYPIFGHWAWGPGGWLGNMTPKFLNSFTHGAVFRDFAGSTVVHTVGGFIALAGAMALGPRLGRKFKKDGGGPTPPHDLTWGAIGGVILWFGWYGFNPGSTLSAMDFAGIGRTLSLGLLATGHYGVPTATGVDTSTVVKGLFYGGGLDQLKAQFIGSATCVIAVFGVSLAIMYFLKHRGVLRLSREAELEGMDLAEHGTAAYHVEFGQGMTYSTPAGLPFNGSHKEAPSEEPVPA